MPPPKKSEKKAKSPGLFASMFSSSAPKSPRGKAGEQCISRAKPVATIAHNTGAAGT